MTGYQKPETLRCTQGKARNQTKVKVALGLSGGVDSAAAGAMLLEQGYDVTGVFIICYRRPGCRTDADRKDALDVAMALGIPFEVVDYREAYREKVLAYFKAEYMAGRTPNPDVLCNREIKFGLFYEEMIEKRKFDYIATGHYARLRSRQDTRHQTPDTRLTLQIPKDKHKDQTYFLYQLKEEQLAHVLFPVGGMTKEAVRARARELKLSVADKKDSVGICFVGEVSVPQFLKDNGVEEKKGEVVDNVGREIGTHKGAWFYTIGQRIAQIPVTSNQIPETTRSKWRDNLIAGGFDLTHLPPLYVVGKDMKRNRLVVGTREECLRNTFEVGNVHWVSQDSRYQIPDTRTIRVRIRHGGALIRARFMIHDSRFKIQLAEPAFGVAAGQSCVFYNGEVCLGGGVIR